MLNDVSDVLDVDVRTFELGWSILNLVDERTFERVWENFMFL